VKTSLLALSLILLPTLALAQWSDNFDAYPAGPLIGNGGWEGWDLSALADANVVPTPNRSAPNSVEILPTSDVVNDMGGLQSGGQWEFTGWCYIPGNAIGEQYLIMLNQYAPVSGPNNWSVQVLFDGTAGQVYDISNTGPSLPMLRDQWVQCRVEIDLDLDLQNFYYDNQLLYSAGWTGHVTSTGGTLTIAVVDLFSNGGSSIYWDDLSLREMGVTAVEPATWGQIKSAF
jgi:hypothetical protein